ncbi:MAG TPA: MotA/TolQ/ExbB proton channel family protein [Cellvibrionaceae bacterium]
MSDSANTPSPAAAAFEAEPWLTDISVTAKDAPPPAGLLDRGLELLQTGGPVVMLLIAMSVIALAIVLVKLMQFRALRIGRRKSATRALLHWQAGKPDLALVEAAACPNPTAQALAQAIRGKQRNLPEHKVREEVLRYGSDVLFHLRRGLRPLEVIGSLAPLLGLLGTVLGMIKAFQQLQAAGNQVNPAILSGGIWEALLTTAVGLCVAIPVVALLNWLERRVDHLAHEMDNIVTQVFTENLSATATYSPASPRAVEQPQSIPSTQASHGKSGSLQPA